MGSPALNDDFLDFLRLPVERSVELVLVGAHAMAARGVARATGDMDVLVRPTADLLDAKLLRRAARGP